MTLSLIVGPPNSGRAGEIRARLVAAAARDPVLVVPTRDDAERFERELCEGGRPLLGASIATFASLAGEVVRATSTPVQPPLSEPQRHALVRAAIRRTRLKGRRLGRSVARPGFAIALDALIAELQAALVEPGELAARLERLERFAQERELAGLYAAYVELRDAAGRSDAGSLATAAIGALREDPGAWRGRPVFVYGFDDLTRAQLELLAALSAACELTVAVNYADRRALAARAALLGTLRVKLGGEVARELPFDESYTRRRTLRHLDRNLFEPGAEPVPLDDGVVLMECAGARGEAEAVGLEIARLLAAGTDPGDVVVVARHPDSAGPLIASVLAGLGIPAALEASVPLAGTCAGTSAIALCRAAANERDLDALLTHLRTDPALPADAVDWVERRVRRGEAETVEEATERWKKPPRHLARLVAATAPAERLRALATSARELAEGAHRRRAPLVSARAEPAPPAANGEPPPAQPPFVAVELRAGVAAAELLTELAGTAALPGCEAPGLAGAIEALSSARVPAWRGAAAGRVRVMSPYRARAARARYLFCVSLQDGEFPSPAPADPLLSEEARDALGIPGLRRREQDAEERYLFHACASRPTERLYLSWQGCDEDGRELARSPFVDEVLDLIGPDPARADSEPLRSRGLERVIPRAEEAPTVRALARALAVRGAGADHAAALASLRVPRAEADAVLELLSALPDPTELPGPLRAPAVLEALGERRTLSAGALEKWIECPYRWFVDHELLPQPLEPESDPLWLGSVVHEALERLYRDPPGSDSIARPADLDRWKRRFAELLAEVAGAETGGPSTAARRSALDRARVQVEAFLEAEAASETELRPRPEMVERGFGFPDDGGEPTPTLRLGAVALRGRIDRIDVAPDGRTAVVRDYKTGKKAPPVEKFVDEGALQVPLYMLVARDVLGLDPIAGLYQPLGAAKPGERRPRGIALRGDERLAGLDLVRNDLREPDEVEGALADAAQRARTAAAGMQGGKIDRKPLGGTCPEHCTYQPICRLERAAGMADAPNGEERE